MKTRAIVLSLLGTLVILTSCSPEKTVPQYQIEQFYKNKLISGGTFSSDGTHLLVSSNESGIFNVYQIEVATGEQQAMTKSTAESFFAVDYVPLTQDILYTADKGGNENDHLYLLSPDGTTKDLTPGEQEKAVFSGWSLDKEAFYYLSNRRNPKYFDLYRMEVGSWKDKMLYQNDKGYEVTGLSWDEKTIALSQSITSSENRLFLFSLATQQMTEISHPRSPGIYAASDFTKDNSHFHYITDVGREFQYLVRRDLKTGKHSTVFEASWDVMYSYNSEHEKYRVVAVNVDGKNDLKVIENASGQEITFPQVPDGDVSSVAISEDERLMRLTVGTSKAPSNIFVYDFDKKDLKKITNTLNPEINPEFLVTAEVVRFPSFDSLQIPAVYYKPLTATAANKMPGLVWVHGGPGGQSRVGYSALIQYLVNHGYAVLMVNNRGSSGYGKSFFKMDDRNHGDKDLMDCIYGKKYLQGLEYIDKERIGIIGGSYGGFITMAAMTLQPDEFVVGVDLFGVTNWLRTLKSIPAYWEAGRKALYAELGDPFTADSARLRSYSPLFNADKIKRPIMVLQGQNDPRVLKVESDEIVEAAKKNGVPVEYVVFPDEGHGFVKKENEIKGYGQILLFLDKHLKQSKN